MWAKWQVGRWNWQGTWWWFSKSPLNIIFAARILFLNSSLLASQWFFDFRVLLLCNRQELCYFVTDKNLCYYVTDKNLKLPGLHAAGARGAWFSPNLQEYQKYFKPINDVTIPGDVGAMRADKEGLRSRDLEGAQIASGRCNTWAKIDRKI